MQKNSLLTGFILSFLFILFVQNAYAGVDISIAAASNNLMQPLSFFTSAVYNICYVVAIVLCVPTLAAYRAFRLNPNHTPLSRPLILTFLVIAIALMPYIAQLSEAAKYTTNSY